MGGVETAELDEVLQETLADNLEVTRANVVDAPRRYEIVSPPMEAITPVEELQPGVAQGSNDRSWEQMNHTHTVHGLWA